jgi:hypothetical protein
VTPTDAEQAAERVRAYVAEYASAPDDDRVDRDDDDSPTFGDLRALLAERDATAAAVRRDYAAKVREAYEPLRLLVEGAERMPSGIISVKLTQNVRDQIAARLAALDALEG